MKKVTGWTPHRYTVKRRIVRHFGVLLALIMVAGLLPLVALAAPLDPYPLDNPTTTLYKEVSGLYYNFNAFARDDLPTEFGYVLYDSENNTTRVHGNTVNYYYTMGPDGQNRAVYCYEPDNPYIWDYSQGGADDKYDILRQPRSENLIAAITQEQRDILAYVLAEGESIYVAGAENPDQIATQLAVWMVGIGHYNDAYFDFLLPSALGEFGIAPTDAICKKARELVRAATDWVVNRPSFVDYDKLVMDWNGAVYSITLDDTNGVFSSNSDWVNAIVDALDSSGFTVATLGNTLTISGDPGPGGTEISVMVGSGQKADIVFMDNEIETPSPHPYFTSRQVMITLNTLAMAPDWRITLVRSAPSIATSAKNPNTNSQTIEAGSNALIRDAVQYTGLPAGEGYIMVGALMDKSTGDPVTVNGQPVIVKKDFTPTAGDGIENIDFAFDATAMAGKTLVVFEEVYIKATYVEGQSTPVAEHKDIDDVAQSIYVATPDSEGGDNPGDDPRDGSSSRPTAGSEDEPDNGSSSTPPEDPNRSTPENPETPYVPGGNNPDIPPVPTVPGNRLTPDGDGWIELDENDVPQGRWQWDNEKLEWIFDDDVPLANIPQTGDNSMSSYLFFLMGVSIIGVSEIIRCGRRKLRNMDR